MEGIAPEGGTDAGSVAPAGGRAAILAIFAACLLPELLLTGADLGLWGDTRWRAVAVAYGGFWVGLIGNWNANYAVQPYAMFLAYGFLHAGALHFIVNMLTLWSLGPPVVERIGQWRFLAVYAAALIGGAAGFAILVAGVEGYAAVSLVTVPMVGASGALFGLAGALIGWELRDRIARRQRLTPVLRALGLLVVLNLVLWWAMNGHLAWQTHLGGFVAGWIAALAFAPADVLRDKAVRTTTPHRTDT